MRKVGPLGFLETKSFAPTTMATMVPWAVICGFPFRFLHHGYIDSFYWCDDWSMPRWKSFEHAKRSVHILVGSKYCEPFLGKMGVHVLLQLNMMRHHQTWYNMTWKSIHDGHAVVMRHVLIWTIRTVRNECRFHCVFAGIWIWSNQVFSEGFIWIDLWCRYWKLKGWKHHPQISMGSP